MEETKVETMEQQTQVEAPEVVSGDVVASVEDSGSSTLVAMAVGAGLFALGVGTVKGVKHLIAKHKAKKNQKSEDDFDDEFDDFDEEPEIEEAEAEDVNAEESKKKKN